jgi:hypothetical protein
MKKLHTPSEEVCECFSQAVDKMPDEINSADLLAFILGLLQFYDIEPEQQFWMAANIVEHAEEEIGDLPSRPCIGEGKSELLFGDPKLAAMFKAGT